MGQATPPAGAKSRGLLITVVSFLVLILAGGAGGAYWYTHRSAAPQTSAEHETAVERGIIPFEPFVVNLADANASRFLRVTIHLLVADDATAKRVTGNKAEMMEARSSILELLTLQTSDHLTTPDGKTALKKAIVDRISPLMSGLKGIDVLFSDFVIQF